jgi:uncharacterized protein
LNRQSVSIKSLPVKRFLQSEAGAVVVWITGTLLLAATLLPWVHIAGKDLAARAAAEELSAFMEWLGAAAGRGKYSRYFSRTLVFSGLLLMPPLIWRLRSIRCPATAALPTTRSGLHPACQAMIGFVLAGGLLWALGMALVSAGAYTVNAGSPPAGKFLSKVLVPTVAASLIEEWLFRGLLLGTWLRIAKPAAACVGTSLVFAFVHFLDPPKGVGITDPNAPLAGFELLGAILRNFTDPRFFAAEFACLFAVGMILAWARVRTGRLWFSIGLHAGWIAAFKGFNLLHNLNVESPLHPWGIGESLRSGLLPLVTLAITAAACRPFIVKSARNPGV